MNRLTRMILSFLLALAFISVTLAGCSSGDTAKVERFVSNTAGTWHRYGNLQDEKLEIRVDGTWIHQSPDEGQWTPIAKGKIEYDAEYKKYEFVDEMSNRVYMVEPVKNGVLSYGYGYHRAGVSIDGFAQYDGSWYQNSGNDADYFLFEAGKWKFFQAQGMGHVSVNSGYLEWDGDKNELLAYEYPNLEPFAKFTIESTNELKKGRESFILQP